MVALRGGKLGRGTGFGVGDDSDPAYTISASHPHAVCFQQNQRDEVRLIGGDGDSAEALTAAEEQAPTVVCIGGDGGESAVDEDMCGTLHCYGDPPAVAEPSHVVRRLTPVECERLQGFPDGWTDVEFKGRAMSDTQRYKMLGNSMAVPVVRWIGTRIDELEKALARAEKFAMKVCGAPDKHHTCLSCKWSRSVSGTDCRPLPLMGCVLEDYEICLVEPGDSCDEWEEREE